MNVWIRTLAVALVAAAPAIAQPAIETDRPDQTETATTVPAGLVQVESGVLYERDEQRFRSTFGGEATIETETVSMPGVLVRIGLAPRLELRLEGEVRRVETRVSGSLLPVEETETVSGAGPPVVGMKVELLEESGAVPQTAFIGDVTLPIGHDAFRPEFVAPAFRFTMSHTLSETMSLAYNIGAEWDGTSPNGAGIYTLTMASDFGDVIGIFIELFGEARTGAAPVHVFDGGFTFLVAPNLQFDIAAGVGLNEHSPDLYALAGFSARLPR